MRGKLFRRDELVLVSLILVIACVFAVTVWIPANWEAGLLRAESLWDIPVSGVGPWFSGWTFGDGQAFAVIAVDPLGADLGTSLGDPGYRYMRAGFGWAAWALSLGQPQFVPYAITVVGLISVVLLFFLAWKLRQIVGPSAWLLCLNPVVFVALARGTAESLGSLLLAAAMLSGGAWWAAALGVVRPSYLLGLAARFRLLQPGLLVCATVVLLSAWRFGWDISQYMGRLTIPGLGYLQAADIGSWIVFVVALVTLIVGVRRRDWSWVASGLFIICLSPDVVESFRNSWRAAGVLPVLWAFGPGFLKRQVVVEAESAVRVQPAVHVADVA